MPLDAAVQSPDEIYSAVAVDEFVGREWLVKEVRRFLAGNPCGYIWIEAEAGVGKTAFSAWLVKKYNYLSHFCGYSGGKSARAALQSLSAQLVREFDLYDNAPGKMLPDWGCTPEGFQVLLKKAAERARDRRRPLVLVIDGLDEAEQVQDELPFGLPLLLPGGVYVVGTFRTGWAPRRPDAPALTLPIGKNDSYNQGDIREYLGRVAAEKWLASKLAEAAVGPEAFVELLARRSGGVWIYLRYVLSELRSGSRRPEALPELPPGLWEYYADQLRRWQNHTAWERVLVPLLATLGVAGEPLPAVALARMAGGLDPRKVAKWCDGSLRALLTTKTIAGMPQSLYEVYHSSFREVLRGDLPSVPGVTYPYPLTALTRELSLAATQAHDRIAGEYLRRFGGLDVGLPVLARHPDAANTDSGYPLRNLARHLSQGERAADLHRLLAVESQAAGEHAVNVWFMAHDHADCVISYLEDLDAAREWCAGATDLALARSQPAASLGQEIRYLLMKASIASRTENITADLLELAIRTRLWSPERGLDHARRITDPASRFEALTAVRAHLRSSGQKNEVAAEALTAAAAIVDERARNQALGQLVPRIPGPRAALGKLAGEAAAVPGETGPPTGQQPRSAIRALETAIAIVDDDARAWALIGLVPRLPASAQEDVLAQALTAAEAIGNARSRAAALTKLALMLTGEQQGEVAAKALTTATAVNSDRAYAEALTGLAPYLPTGRKARALSQALAAAIAITDDYSRAQALASLAPSLPADLISQALEAASKITGEDALAAALAGQAPSLPASLAAQALATARTISSPRKRAPVMASLASRLPDQESEILAEALVVAGGLAPDWERAEALIGVAPYLSDEETDQALAAATKIADYYSRARALSGLAPYLTDGLLAEALTAAITIPDKDACATALAELAPYLPASLATQALASMLAISDSRGPARATALTGLASHLPGPLLAEALDAASAISSESARATALAGLAPHLPVTDRALAFTQALAAVDAMADDPLRGDILAGLAPFLPPELLASAIAAGARRRADVLIAVLKRAEHIYADENKAFADLMRTSLDGAARQVCLTVIGALAPEIAKTGGTAAITHCADAVTDVHRWWP